MGFDSIVYVKNMVIFSKSYLRKYLLTYVHKCFRSLDSAIATLEMTISESFAEMVGLLF